MTAEPSGHGRGGGVPIPPAKYQAGSLNSKQPVPTLDVRYAFLFFGKY